MWNLKEDLPAWIIDRLPQPPAPAQPLLELPLPRWTEPPTDEEDEEPRGTGGTVIVIDL